MARPRRFSTKFGRAFGIGKYYYGFNPYTLDPNARGPGLAGWVQPAEVVGHVDLRNLEQQAATGGAPAGLAFVASLQPVAVPIATSSHFGEENVTGAMQDAWEAELGYRPQGEKLADLLFDQLTNGADPSGDAACKPLMPSVGGFFNLYVRGHSLVRRKSANGSPEMAKVLTALKRQYRALRRQSLDGELPASHYRKVLGYWVRKYGLPHRAFQPNDLPDEADLPPETTISDDFNRADGEIGANWTEDGDIDIVTNAAQHVSSGTGGIASAYYNTQLSSDDHYSQHTILTNPATTGDAQSASIARRATGAFTFYYLTWLDSTNDQLQLWKVVAGSFTSLLTSNETLATNNIYRIKCDGSDIVGYKNAVEELSTTDTAITGNLNCGIFTYKGSGTTPRVDDFEASDLAVARAFRQTLLGVGV